MANVCDGDGSPMAMAVRLSRDEETPGSERSGSAGNGTETGDIGQQH
jgi:hypothetical protein